MQDNKAVVRSFVEALGKGDVEGVKALMSEDIAAICTGSCVLSGTRSYTDIAAAAGMLASATKNGITFKFVSMTAEEDRVSCEMEGSSTLVNGTPYNNQYHFLFFIRDGRIYRMKEYLDTKLVDATLGPLMAAAQGG